MNNHTFSFHAASPRTAELTIADGSPGLCFVYDKRKSVHTLGFAGRPRFLLEQPFSPDDAWQISVSPAGALAADLPRTPDAVDGQVASWLGRPLDSASLAVLHALPSGRYALVRVARTAQKKDAILLGNEKVKSPANALELCYAPPYYAAIFGADAAFPPALGSLLVGLTVLNVAGTSLLDGVWLFDFAGPSAAPSAPGEILCAIPLADALVLDAMAEYDPKSTDASRQRWANERGPAFVAWSSAAG